MKSSNILNINILTLTLTHFLWGFVNYVYIIQIQPYLLSIYGTSPEAAQMLGTILSIGSFSAVIPLLLGFFADFYGRKNLILIGEVISVIGMIGLAFSSSEIWLSLASIVIYNIGIGIYDPPLQGLIHESAIEKRGIAYSVVYNSASIAGILASFLIQIWSELYFFFQISCFLLVGAVIINILVISDLSPNNKNITISSIFKNPLSRYTAIAFALDSFFWGLPLSIANGIYIILFGVDVSFIATLTFIMSLLLVLLQYPAGFLVDRFGRFFGLLVGEIAGIIWIFLVFTAIQLPDIASELLIIAYAILGISVAFWRPSVTLSFIEIDPSAVSTNFGLLAFMQRMGYVPTAVIAGVIFTHFGFTPLLLLTFLGTLIVISIFVKIDRLEKIIFQKNNSNTNNEKLKSLNN